MIYRTQQSNCEDNSPDGHEDETSHQHEPPTFALDQQVLKTPEYVLAILNCYISKNLE